MAEKQGPLKRTSASEKRRRRKKGRDRAKGALTLLLALLLTAILTVIIVCAYVLVFTVSFVNGENKIDLEQYKENQDQTTIVYAQDSNNELMEIARLHGEQNRVWVAYRENSPDSVVPQSLADAYVYLEDKRFKEHKGVDWLRTVKSVLIFFKPGETKKQGGSTITQQLIKNLTGENKPTFNRKFYEILTALNLERHINKETILEAYMNTVYMGRGCYGVQTASERYFGKNVQDLNLAECASLAAITQNPSQNDPLLHPEENRGRQAYCLDTMLREGGITQEEYDEAIAYKMVFTNSEGYVPSKNLTSAQRQTEKTIQSYYVDFVIQSVIADLMKQYGYTKSQASNLIYSGGLRIYSAVDMNIQSRMENVYVNRKAFPPENKAIPDAQSSMTVMDYSGRVLGMVGGAGEKTQNRGLNRAANSYRQPGSSIKPLSVYSTAIDKKYVTWSTKVQNYGIPNYYGDGRIGPKNYGGNPGSPDSYIAVQKALSKSLNTVSAQLVRRMGTRLCYTYAHDKFRLSKLHDADINTSSMAVGGTDIGVSTLQMAAAFAAFGNGGKYFEPYCYYKVTNANGSKVYLRHAETEGDQIISPDTADIMNELLQTVVTDPAGWATGHSYGLKNMPLFAKTGTTSDNYDRWFCGGTPYYVAAVWFGCDQPKSVARYVKGNPAGRIFDEVMNRIHKGLAKKSFTKFSPYVVKIAYCKETGLLAGESCTDRATGWYSKDNLPAYCTECVTEAPTEPEPAEEPEASEFSETTTEAAPTEESEPSEPSEAA